MQKNACLAAVVVTLTSIRVKVLKSGRVNYGLLYIGIETEDCSLIFAFSSLTRKQRSSERTNEPAKSSENFLENFSGPENENEAR